MTLIDWAGFLGAAASWASLTVFLHTRRTDQINRDRQSTATEHEAVRRTINDLAHTVQREFLPKAEFETARREWRDEWRSDIQSLAARIDHSSNETHARIDRLIERKDG